MGFWDTVGKITSVLMDEAAKKQEDMQRKAGNQLREYERKVNRAQNSDKMSNPAYATKVNEAKQKLAQAKKSVYGVASTNDDGGNRSSAEIGSASLREIASPIRFANKPGVYILKLNGRIMKVGSAEIGVQKRMQQYYGLNTSCGLSYITGANRDSINITFQHCPVAKCNELESKLFDKYGGVENMPWAKRRPQNNNNTYQLKI
jgi:hypothetical protein